MKVSIPLAADNSSTHLGEWDPSEEASKSKNDESTESTLEEPALEEGGLVANDNAMDKSEALEADERRSKLKESSTSDVGREFTSVSSKEPPLFCDSIQDRSSAASSKDSSNPTA